MKYDSYTDWTKVESDPFIILQNVWFLILSHPSLATTIYNFTCLYVQLKLILLIITWINWNNNCIIRLRFNTLGNVVTAFPCLIHNTYTEAQKITNMVISLSNVLTIFRTKNYYKIFKMLHSHHRVGQHHLWRAFTVNFIVLFPHNIEGAQITVCVHTECAALPDIIKIKKISILSNKVNNIKCRRRTKFQ